jgi:hypothetical protein
VASPELSTCRQPVGGVKIKCGIMSVMGKRGWLAVVALVGAVALLLGGCTGEAKPNTSTVPVARSSPSVSAASTSPRPAPTVRPYPADVPLTGHNVKPGERPPVYPAAARARTQEGANAFVEFYLRTWDWAYATTNPSYMKHYSGASCGLCGGLASGIQKTAEAGHWYLGGRLSVESVSLTVRGPVTAPSDYCFAVRISGTAQSVVDHTGKVFNGEAAHAGVPLKLCAVWTDAGWRISYWARST